MLLERLLIITCDSWTQDNSEALNYLWWSAMFSFEIHNTCCQPVICNTCEINHHWKIYIRSFEVFSVPWIRFCTLLNDAPEEDVKENVTTFDRDAPETEQLCRNIPLNNYFHSYCPSMCYLQQCTLSRIASCCQLQSTGVCWWWRKTCPLDHRLSWRRKKRWGRQRLTNCWRCTEQ